MTQPFAPQPCPEDTALADEIAARQAADAALQSQINGTTRVRAFPFAYNTAGILTGHTVYVPTIGDLLMDAWIEVDTAWNGTTPKGDIFVGGQTVGLFASATTVATMTVVDSAVTPSPGLLARSGGGASPLTAGDTNATRYAAAKFVTADPIKVCVSQNGTLTGADPGSTQGAAVLYLVTATPA